MAEFVFNVFELVLIKLFLFFVNNDFEFRMSFESLEISGTARKKILSQKATSIKNNMKNVCAFAAFNLHEVRKDQKTHVNRHKKSTSTHELNNRT